MTLPGYDKSKRKKTFKMLPKGAYVVQIKSARQDASKSGNGSHLTIAFDVAEGEYKGFYQNQYENSTSEDKKWPRDAIFYLTIPDENSKPYTWDTWNTFFADLEDSNNGFVFGGDLRTLKGKLIGGKFHIEQNEYNGTTYDHTRMKWTCIADDVRSGDFGKLPNDKLVARAQASSNIPTTSEGFMTIPDTEDDEIPF